MQIRWVRQPLISAQTDQERGPRPSTQEYKITLTQYNQPSFWYANCIIHMQTWVRTTNSLLKPTQTRKCIEGDGQSMFFSKRQKSTSDTWSVSLSHPKALSLQYSSCCCIYVHSKAIKRAVTIATNTIWLISRNHMSTQSMIVCTSIQYYSTASTHYSTNN